MTRSGRPSSRGVALLCDGDGVVRETVRDGLGLARRPDGLTLPQVVAAGSRAKAARFVETVRRDGAAFHWELNVELCTKEAVTLSFAGTHHRGVLLVIAARVLDDVFSLYEELSRVNNEQANLVRRAIKDRVLVTTRQASVDTSHLDDLSRLNNEMANLQRDLAKKNRTLERLNEQKDMFLGMAAHDLRNPISSIMGYAKLLLEVSLDDGHRRTVLESIGRVSEHMLALVNDLLDVSVIESGKLELHREACSLSEILDRRVDFFQLLAEKKEIRIDRDIPPGVVVQLDPVRFEQVADNLVSNAVKYSPPRSTVVVSLASTAGGVRLRVQDQGPGLSEADRARIFGAFQRLSARPTAGEKSTGLGLAITKRIVTAHGGSIDVETALGQGSTFVVQLPHGV